MHLFLLQKRTTFAPKLFLINRRLAQQPFQNRPRRGLRAAKFLAAPRPCPCQSLTLGGHWQGMIVTLAPSIAVLDRKPNVSHARLGKLLWLTLRDEAEAAKQTAVTVEVLHLALAEFRPDGIWHSTIDIPNVKNQAK